MSSTLKYGRTWDKTDIIAQIQMLADELGRPPRQREFENCPDTASHTTAKRKFGTWNKAVEAVGYETDDGYANHTKDKKTDLIRGFNRLANNMDGIPGWSDVNANTRHSKNTYQRYFDTHEEVCRLSNVVPPVDYVLRALREFYNGGLRSYVTVSALRKSMYPGGDMNALNSDFGVTRRVNDSRSDSEVMDTWEYPRMSAKRISDALKKIHRRDEYRITLSLWNDAQKNRYRIRMEDNNE